MKIITETPEKIVVKISNFTLFIGSLFLIAGAVCGTFALFAPELPVIFPIVLFIIPGVVGLLMILSGSTYLITIDKETKTVTYHIKSFIKQNSETYSFEEISNIETKASISLHKPRVPVLQSFLVLKNGTRLMLDYQHGPRSRVEAGELVSAKLIADYIGVSYANSNKPLNEDEFDTVKI